MINCLALDTSYSFWKKQASDYPGYVSSLKTIIDKNSDWLGRENWDCTKWFDGPVPSCLKHDVTWDSLRRFESGTSNINEIDKAWNPRNKYLADSIFYADISVNGCDYSTWNSGDFCSLVPNTLKAFIMTIGVRHMNSLSWPYTQYDKDHIEQNSLYMRFDIPSIFDVAISTSNNAPKKYIVTWRYNSGTANTAG